MTLTLEFEFGFATVGTAEGTDAIAVLLTLLLVSSRVIFVLVRKLIEVSVSSFRSGKENSGFISLGLPPEFAARPAESLCARCVYAHIVCGHNRDEKIFSCGYAFPLRETFFIVRDCTDFKAKDAPRLGRKVGFAGGHAEPEWEELPLTSAILTHSGESK